MPEHSHAIMPPHAHSADSFVAAADTSSKAQVLAIATVPSLTVCNIRRKRTAPLFVHPYYLGYHLTLLLLSRCLSFFLVWADIYGGFGKYESAAGVMVDTFIGPAHATSFPINAWGFFWLNSSKSHRK